MKMIKEFAAFVFTLMLLIIFVVTLTYGFKYANHRATERRMEELSDQAADEFLGFIQQVPDAREEGQILLAAPSVCEVGELVRIDLRESTVTTTLLVVTIPELLATDDFEIIDDGKRAFFSSRGAGEL